MTRMAKGDVIGRGRDAVIVDHGPGLVLRRPLRPRAVSREIAVMRWLDERGYPSPRVIEEIEDGLVMERVDGPTMLEDLAARTVSGHMTTLAHLHAQLHMLPAPPGLPAPYGVGTTLLHGDLHPGNVILSPEGPKVIDWTNACLGPAGADLANAWLLIACVGVPDGRLARVRERTTRSVAVQALLSAAGQLGEVESARSSLEVVLADRHHDPNMTPSELAAMSQLVRREAR